MNGHKIWRNLRERVTGEFRRIHLLGTSVNKGNWGRPVRKILLTLSLSSAFSPIQRSSEGPHKNLPVRPMPVPMPKALLQTDEKTENAMRNRGIIDGNHHHHTQQGKSSTKVGQFSRKR